MVSGIHADPAELSLSSEKSSVFLEGAVDSGIHASLVELSLSSEKVQSSLRVQ
jgi:hypothetical protein